MDPFRGVRFPRMSRHERLRAARLDRGYRCAEPQHFGLVDVERYLTLRIFTLYVPLGVSTGTVSPTSRFKMALPIGDSLEILPS